MTSASDRTAQRVAARVRRSLADDIERALGDAGMTARQLAAASGVDSGYLARILAGSVRPSIETYARLAAPLGGDLSARIFPNTGPRLRDHTQAPILELTLRTCRPRFGPYTEVEVRRPARGWIDAVLHEPREHVAVATEIQGQLRRLEQLVRWQTMKAESLPSWDGWPHLGDPETRISRLLVVRRTRATRAVASEYAAQLHVAYPAHPDDALAALTGTAGWPGAALVWVTLDARGARWASGR